MRTCPYCGHMLSEKDTICFKCGRQLIESEINKNSNQNETKVPEPPLQNLAQPKNNKPLVMNSSNKNNNQKNNSDFKLYIIAGISVILIIGIVFGVIKLMSDSPESASTPNTEIKLSEPELPAEDETKEVTPSEDETTEEPVETEPEEKTITLKDDEHLVTNSGYSYPVSNNFTEKDYGDNGVNLLDKENSKEIKIAIVQNTLLAIRENLDTVKKIHTDSGITVSDVVNQEINGIDVTIFYLEQDGIKVLRGMLDAEYGEIFVIDAYNKKTNEFDINILTEGIEIVSRAIKEENTV